MRKAILAFLLFGLLGAIHAFAQGQDFSKTEMKVQKVAGTVYMLEGAGGNIGEIGRASCRERVFSSV